MGAWNPVSINLLQKFTMGGKEWADVCRRVRSTVCFHKLVKGFWQFEWQDTNFKSGIKNMFLLSN